VMSLHALSALGLAMSVVRRSAGSLCTTPPGSRGPLTASRETGVGARSPAVEEIRSSGPHVLGTLRGDVFSLVS
jgi:hypothetical protein